MIVLGSILLSVFAPAGLGLRGLDLLLAALVALVPVVYLASNLLKYVIPPRIEIYLPEDATLRLRDISPPPRNLKHEADDRATGSSRSGNTPQP